MKNEPVAYVNLNRWKVCNNADDCFSKTREEDCDVAVYTHPAKTIKNLTDEEINQVAIDMGMFGDLSHDEIELYRNLLRKAQEK